MHRPSPSSHWVLALCAVILGCQPDIGDSCSTNADCSLTNDRLCDPTSPGGYCTQFNCQPGKCPDEAACVGFYTKLSSECSLVLNEQRFERSFCMKKCTSSNDCRTSEGYDCLSPPAEVSAIILEYGDAAATKVCMVKLDATPRSGAMSEPEPAICSVPDASPPPVRADSGSEGGSGVVDGAGEAHADASDAGSLRDAAGDVATGDSRVDR